MQTEKEKYNGWSNYATWRINLELIDGRADYLLSGPAFDSVSALADYLKEYAFEVVFDQSEDNESVRLMRGYADAFMGDVNWYEIAEYMAEDYPKLTARKCEDGKHYHKEDEDYPWCYITK